MKKLFSLCAIAVIALNCAAPAFAIKEFGETFAKHYVDESKSEEFKKLVGEAKCNVCHVDGDKKKHNPYGKALKDAGLSKKEFSPQKFKEKPDDTKKSVIELFKKVEDKKAEGADKTFGEKIKDGKLPGGDVKGK